MRRHTISLRKTPFCLLFLLLPLAIVSCSGPPEEHGAEAQLRALINQGATYAEEKNLTALKELVSEQYQDERGLNKRTLDDLLGYYFATNASVHLLLRFGEMTFPDSSQALARVYVAMAGQPIANADTLASLRADLYLFDLTFTDEGTQDWKVTQAQWQRAQPGDFLSGK